MVQVKFRQDDNRLYVDALGHATGNPEVCAAVSAVMSVLSAVAYEYEETDGRYTAVMWKRPTEQAVYDAVKYTMYRIMETYDDLVRVMVGF